MLDKIGNIGNIISREVLIEEFELIETKEPYYISENIIFPGEIPNYFNFEKRQLIRLLLFRKKASILDSN